jgi:hypothetical protein
VFGLGFAVSPVLADDDDDRHRVDELVRAIRAGTTYANVHSSTFGPGEIRGQISGHDD